MYTYDDVKLKIVQLLNSTILNNSFVKLQNNDCLIIPESDYTPRIWENKWYNDDNILGYNEGYCVWRNVYPNGLSLFLDIYGDLVYSYALENDQLKSYLISSWTQLKNAFSDNQETLNIWKERYNNVISGYSKDVSYYNDDGIKIVLRKLILLQLFDYGTYSGKRECLIETLELLHNILVEVLDEKNLFDYYSSEFNLTRDSENNTVLVCRQVIVDLASKCGISAPTEYTFLNISNCLKSIYATLENRVQIYVSTIDDNKEFLSNETAWNSVVLSDLNAYENFIKNQIDSIFSLHIKEYHMDGLLTIDLIDDILLANDLQNFNINNVHDIIQLKDHDMYINNEGFDYVIDYKRRGSRAGNSFDGSLKNFITYLWYRLWNSGFLEHGGIVKCNPITNTETNKSNPDNYVVKIDFNWNLGDNVNPIYNYDETSGTSFGDAYERYYYGYKNGNSSYPIYHKIDLSENMLNGKHYFVRVTPTILLSSDVNLSSYKYNDIDILKVNDYPELPSSNKEQTYIDVEVHHLKNDSFCFTRSDTDKLDSSVVLYYQYYVSGFKKIIDVNYDFRSTTIEGIEDRYEWTGNLIKPYVIVKNNIGDTLVLNKNYTIVYYTDDKKIPNFIDPGNINVLITGKSPYIGMKTIKYQIVKN